MTDLITSTLVCTPPETARSAPFNVPERIFEKRSRSGNSEESDSRTGAAAGPLLAPASG